MGRTKRARETAEVVGHIEPFVGREEELGQLSRALVEGGVHWVTGPAGIGKTALIRRALGDRGVVELDGAWMDDADEAIADMAEQLGVKPPSATRVRARGLLPARPCRARCLRFR